MEPTYSFRKRPSRAAAYARFLGASFVVNLQAAMEYRGNFLLQVFGMMLNNAAFALFWAVLIQKTGGVGGYGFADVMFIWAVCASSFGLANVLAGNVRYLGQIVRSGDLDVYLLQPKDPFVNILFSRTIVSAWGDLAYGLIVAALLPGMDASRMVMFVTFVITGAAFFAATFAIAESLTMFMGDSSGVSDAVLNFLVSFSTYPEGIYDKGMRWVFYSLLPSGFIAFIPLAAFKALDWRLVPALLAAAAAYVAASYAIFKLGLRRYESGNQIGERQ